MKIVKNTKPKITHSPHTKFCFKPNSVQQLPPQSAVSTKSGQNPKNKENTGAELGQGRTGCKGKAKGKSQKPSSLERKKQVKRIKSDSRDDCGPAAVVATFGRLSAMACFFFFFCTRNSISIQRFVRHSLCSRAAGSRLPDPPQSTPHACLLWAPRR